MANNRDSCGSYLSDEELVIIRLGGRSCGPLASNGPGYTVSQIVAKTSYSFLAKTKIYLVQNCNGKSEKPHSIVATVFCLCLICCRVNRTYTFSCDTICKCRMVSEVGGSNTFLMIFSIQSDLRGQHCQLW